MTTEVLEKLRSLPPDKQQEVEDLIIFLAEKYVRPVYSAKELIEPRRNSFGNSKQQAEMPDSSNEGPDDY